MKEDNLNENDFTLELYDSRDEEGKSALRSEFHVSRAREIIDLNNCT